MGWWQRLLGIEVVEQRQTATIGSVESAVLASLDGLRGTASGVAVSEESSLRNTAVLACVRILSNFVAMLPLPVYKRLSPRGKERAPEYPLYQVLQEQANPELTAFELRRWLMQGVLLWGDVTQMSFAFSVEKDGQSWDRGAEPHVRTIHTVSALADVSPVTYPAYPQTEVLLRAFLGDAPALGGQGVRRGGGHGPRWAAARAAALF